MAWQTPKINWTSPAFINYDDFNRIEGNVLELKKAATIKIVDNGNYFASDNIEGVLAELYQLCR